MGEDLVFYFAYGSNLDEDQIRFRCPDSKLIDVGYVKDYEFKFTTFAKRRNGGVADIVYKTGSKLWGALYELTAGDLEKLDTFEEYPIRYGRIIVDVHGKNKIYKNVQTYFVNAKTGFYKPSKEYLDLILNGAEKLKFPKNYISEIIKASKSG